MFEPAALQDGAVVSGKNANGFIWVEQDVASMAGMRILVRLIVSTIGAVIPLLFLSGTYSPLASYAPGLLGGQGSITTALTGFFGGNSVNPLVPIGAAGLTGFVVWTFLQRALREVEAATYRPSMKGMNPQELLKSMQMPSMPWMTAQAITSAEVVLPADLTKSQFSVLKTCRRGFTKSKDLARQLSMDKSEVEKELFALKTNGYLSKSNKLTSKALNVLGN